MSNQMRTQNRNHQSARSMGYSTDGNTARRSEGLDYIRGNAVPKMQRSRAEIAHREKIRRNQEKARKYNVGYVIFLGVMVALLCFILVSYLTLQSSITNTASQIAKQEAQLATLKQANDEMESRLGSSVDLEEIRRIAIDELGMKYAEEGQMETFVSEDSDYVRQVTNLD